MPHQVDPRPVQVKTTPIQRRRALVARTKSMSSMKIRPNTVAEALHQARRSIPMLPQPRPTLPSPLAASKNMMHYPSVSTAPRGVDPCTASPTDQSTPGLEDGGVILEIKEENQDSEDDVTYVEDTTVEDDNQADAAPNSGKPFNRCPSKLIH